MSPRSCMAELVRLGRRQALPQICIFYLTLKKASEYNEKPKEKSLILREFTELS